MSPHNPNIEIAARLELSCSVVDAPSGADTPDISTVIFHHAGHEYSVLDTPNYVSVLNTTTAVLAVDNVTDNWFGHVMCELSDDSSLYATQSVRVYRKCRHRAVNYRSGFFNCKVKTCSTLQSVDLVLFFITNRR